MIFEDKERIIMDEIKKGNVNYIKKLLMKNKRVIDGLLDEEDNTMLHLAIKHGRKKLVKLLLSYGANTNKYIYSFRNPISYNLKALALSVFPPELSKEQVGIFKLLVENGAEINDYTLLKVLIENNHVNLIEYLLKKGLDVNSYVNDYKYTILHEASIHHKIDTVKLLLKYGADFTLKTKSDNTPLELMTEILYEPTVEAQSIVNLLLDHGANMTDGKILLTAITRNYYDLVSILVERGVELYNTELRVNIINHIGINIQVYGLTPQAYWLRGQIQGDIYKLIDDGNIPGIEDYFLDMYTVDGFEHYARKEVFFYPFGLYLTRLKNLDGKTPLEYAISKNNKRVIDLIFTVLNDISDKNDMKHNKDVVKSFYKYIDVNYYEAMLEKLQEEVFNLSSEEFDKLSDIINSKTYHSMNKNDGEFLLKVKSYLKENGNMNYENRINKLLSLNDNDLQTELINALFTNKMSISFLKEFALKMKQTGKDINLFFMYLMDENNLLLLNYFITELKFDLNTDLKIYDKPIPLFSLIRSVEQLELLIMNGAKGINNIQSNFLEPYFSKDVSEKRLSPLVYRILNYVVGPRSEYLYKQTPGEFIELIKLFFKHGAEIVIYDEVEDANGNKSNESLDFLTVLKRSIKDEKDMVIYDYFKKLKY